MSTTYLTPGETVTQSSTAKLSYGMDWSDWLTSGATITTSTWTLSGGDSQLSKDTPANTTTGTTVRVYGGTVGQTYKLTNHIVTTGESPAQEDDRWIKIKIV